MSGENNEERAAFERRCNTVARLVDQVEDDNLRLAIYAAVEDLVNNRQPRFAAMFTRAPDTIEGLM